MCYNYFVEYYVFKVFCMKKRLIILAIHLIVIALVLILTMVSLAWYTSSATGSANNAIITAEGVDGVGITDIADNIVHYKGETGLGGQDKPYVAQKIMSIEQTSKSIKDVMVCNVDDVYVIMPDNTKITYSTEGFENIKSSITYRIKIVDIDENNQVTNVRGTFAPDENGMMINDNEALEESERKLRYQDETYFSVEKSLTSATCKTTAMLEIIFLDAESYVNYLDGKIEDVTPFMFSDYDYMGAKFFIEISIGLDQDNSISIIG